MDGLRRVLHGEVYVPAAVFLPEAQAAQTGEDAAGLTSRQLQILPLLAEGMPNKRIAATLGVTEGTVKQHLKDLFRRLNARNRIQAVNEATRLGLLRK
jgi:DNA-binding NarL/FixJ family response regulator